MIDLDREVLTSTIEDKVHHKVVVLKIGGSCLVDGRTIDTVLDKIIELRKEGIVPVLVVSALKGLTDTLLDVASSDRQDLKMTDSIISQGEQLSANVMQSKLESLGIDSEPILLDDPKFPIVTNGNYGNADVLLDQTEERIKNKLYPLLQEDIIPIVPGFVGVSEDGDVTTMGRGASDTSAVLLGRGLGASEVILLKDVPGILSCDPDIVESPSEISEITVNEALELGNNGGEVLCSSALKYKPKDLNIRVVNYDNSNILDSGTEIIENQDKNIEYYQENSKKSLISVIGKKIIEKEISKELKKKTKNFELFTVKSNSVSYYTDAEYQKKLAESLHEIVQDRSNLTAVSAITDLTLMKVEFSNHVEPEHLMKKIDNSFKGTGVNPIRMNSNVNEINIFLEDQDSFKKAKKVLRGLF